MYRVVGWGEVCWEAGGVLSKAQCDAPDVVLTLLPHSKTQIRLLDLQQVQTVVMVLNCMERENTLFGVFNQSPVVMN